MILKLYSISIEPHLELAVHWQPFGKDFRYIFQMFLGEIDGSMRLLPRLLITLNLSFLFLTGIPNFLTLLDFVSDLCPLTAVKEFIHPKTECMNFSI